MALYESILASPYRTLNGEEADYFYVPVLDSCIITRAEDAPHLSMQVAILCLCYWTLNNSINDQLFSYINCWKRKFKEKESS